MNYVLSLSLNPLIVCSCLGFRHMLKADFIQKQLKKVRVALVRPVFSVCGVLMCIVCYLKGKSLDYSRSNINNCLIMGRCAFARCASGVLWLVLFVGQLFTLSIRQLASETMPCHPA